MPLIWWEKDFLKIIPPDPDQFQSSSSPKPIKKVEEDDNFRQELSTALQMETNIVPVTDNFQWPEPDSLPEVGKDFILTRQTIIGKYL